MSDSLKAAADRLQAAGVDSARLDARLLWDHAMRNPAVFETYIARRCAREPLAYITGHKEFWSLEFEVGPGILVPRPATETIVEQVLEAYPDPSRPLTVLDLGTGSGCLLAAILKEFPKATGLGIDCSEQARGTATANLATHGLAERAEIRAGDWGRDLSGTWDVIVSNPPYIPSADIADLDPEVRLYEPSGALDGGADGLDAVRALAPVLKRHLAGWGFVEIGAGQGAAAAAILAQQGLAIPRIAADLAGIERVLVTHP